jgi:cephalosporin hydroxylase
MIQIDTRNGTVHVSDDSGVHQYSMDTPEAFALIARAWLRAGWDSKYVYTFTWLGRPVIQLPDDLVRLQELIYRVKPDVIVETGVAHGGSLVFYAGLCKVIGKGKVVGVDIEIRPHNRGAIEEHELSPYITLIEGDSVHPTTLGAVTNLIQPGDTVLVCLDSNHSKDHVLRELGAYAPLVSVGSYIIAMDGIMEQVVGAPRTEPDWEWNNPRRAALQFTKENPRFVLEKPMFGFNESDLSDFVTYWPDGIIKRTR